MAITRRREAEDKRAAIQQVVDDNLAVGRLATWETKTTARIQRNTITNMARSLEVADKQSLQARRRRLTELLASDDEVYKGELAGLQETSKQRAVRMVAVARALKLEREEKRKALATEQYNRQWREGCDDLRLIDSDKFRNHCMQGVQGQLREKAEARKASTMDEMRWAKVMEDGRLQKMQKESDEIKKRQAFNQETKMALMDQMDNQRAAKEAEAARTEQDRLNFMQQLEDEAEDNRRGQAQMKEAQMTQLRRIREFNEETMGAKNKALQMQREQEMRDLAQKMEAHRAEGDMRAAEKKQMRDDIFKYQEYLRQRKVEEKQLERELEVMCQEELQAANAKRDAQWMKERLGREQLLANVYQTRREQIYSKDREALRREEEVGLERQAIEREIQRAQRIEEEEEEQQRQKERQLAGDLDRQKTVNRNRADIQQTEERNEFEAAQDAEKKYSAFLVREKQSMWAEKYEPKGYGLKKIPWN